MATNPRRRRQSELDTRRAYAAELGSEALERQDAELAELERLNGRAGGEQLALLDLDDVPRGRRPSVAELYRVELELDRRNRGGGTA